MFGINTPIWMTESDPVYVQKHAQNKYVPVVKKYICFILIRIMVSSYDCPKILKLFFLEILHLF